MHSRRPPILYCYHATTVLVSLILLIALVSLLCLYGQAAPTITTIKGCQDDLSTNSTYNCIGTQVLTITGTGFLPPVTVNINTSAVCSVLTNTSYVITCMLPTLPLLSNQPSPANVSVSTPVSSNMTTASASKFISYRSRPFVSSVSGCRLGMRQCQAREIISIVGTALFYQTPTPTNRVSLMSTTSSSIYNCGLLTNVNTTMITCRLPMIPAADLNKATELNLWLTVSISSYNNYSSNLINGIQYLLPNTSSSSSSSSGTRAVRSSSSSSSTAQSTAADDAEEVAKMKEYMLITITITVTIFLSFVVAFLTRLIPHDKCVACLTCGRSRGGRAPRPSSRVVEPRGGDDVLYDLPIPQHVREESHQNDSVNLSLLDHDHQLPHAAERTQPTATVR